MPSDQIFRFLGLSAHVYCAILAHTHKDTPGPASWRQVVTGTDGVLLDGVEGLCRMCPWHDPIRSVPGRVKLVRVERGGRPSTSAVAASLERRFHGSIIVKA